MVYIYVFYVYWNHEPMSLGRMTRQPGGYKAFIPGRFPSAELLEFEPTLLAKAAQAERLMGRLDGIAHTLPDGDFFIGMYLLKDATGSAQIEGTRATMLDALEMSAGVNRKDTDADDILHYVKAFDYGRERLKRFPFSLRFIRELHKVLMSGARSSHFADPGSFRRTQNWIGGTNIRNALFVPPPVHEMADALSDLERFLQKEDIIPVIQAGLIHAQFETIHPFLDGNGRTGRLLLTLFFYHRAVLEKPVLFLSSHLKRHQRMYYDRLNAYHNGRPHEWIDFFLDAVIETAEAGIATSKRITSLRTEDMLKVQALGKREASSGVSFLQQLFSAPIVTVGAVAMSMGYTRAGAGRLIDRFVNLGILEPRDEHAKYGRSFIYRRYVSLFHDP